MERHVKSFRLHHVPDPVSITDVSFDEPYLTLLLQPFQIQIGATPAQIVEQRDLVAQSCEAHRRVASDKPTPSCDQKFHGCVVSCFATVSLVLRLLRRDCSITGSIAAQKAQ